MAINNVNANTTAANTSVQRQASPETQSRLASNNVPQGDHEPVGAGNSVSISSQASRLSEAESRLSSVNEVNQERVESIRASINEGTFEVNAESIAENLLEQDNFF